MKRLGFRCAVVIPDLVDSIQASRSSVRESAIRCHCKQFTTQFDGGDRHNVVNALPIFGRHMLGDDSVCQPIQEWLGSFSNLMSNSNPSSSGFSALKRVAGLGAGQTAGAAERSKGLPTV